MQNNGFGLFACTAMKFLWIDPIRRSWSEKCIERSAPRTPVPSSRSLSRWSLRSSRSARSSRCVRSLRGRGFSRSSTSSIVFATTRPLRRIFRTATGSRRCSGARRSISIKCGEAESPNHPAISATSSIAASFVLSPPVGRVDRRR